MDESGELGTPDLDLLTKSCRVVELKEFPLKL